MNDHGRARRGDSGVLRGSAEALSKAVDLLALRPHFRAELALKLARRAFEGEVVIATLDRLEELGYLDDLAAARGFAEGKALRAGWGPRRLRAELARRGVADDTVATVVAGAFADGEGAAVRSAAERWTARGGSGRDRLARYLDRRGFSKAAIVEILSEFAGESGSQHEEF
ncbi:MAG: regulatory protein RecX [Acidobacteria bacterium]|nr:regulatory protein RecX [Acidobacteriota bacterium]